mgnify:CR=1 FL=1
MVFLFLMNINWTMIMIYKFIGLIFHGSFTDNVDFRSNQKKANQNKEFSMPLKSQCAICLGEIVPIILPSGATFASNSMPNSLRSLKQPSIIGKSESDPITIITLLAIQILPFNAFKYFNLNQPYYQQIFFDIFNIIFGNNQNYFIFYYIKTRTF